MFIYNESCQYGEGAEYSHSSVFRETDESI